MSADRMLIAVLVSLHVLQAVAYNNSPRNCLRGCLNKFHANAAPELKPLYTILNENVTLADARLNFDTVCSAFHIAYQCLESCEDGREILAKLTQTAAVDICIDQRDQWKNSVLKCEIENRKQIIAECGKDTLLQYNDRLEQMRILGEQLEISSDVVQNEEFKYSFGIICRYTDKIARCTTKVYEARCDRATALLMASLLEKSMGGLKPEQLRMISSECEDMGRTFEMLAARSEMQNNYVSQAGRQSIHGCGVAVLTVVVLSLL